MLQLRPPHLLQETWAKTPPVWSSLNNNKQVRLIKQKSFRNSPFLFKHFTHKSHVYTVSLSIPQVIPLELQSTFSARISKHTIRGWSFDGKDNLLGLAALDVYWWLAVNLPFSHNYFWTRLECLGPSSQATRSVTTPAIQRHAPQYTDLSWL